MSRYFYMRDDGHTQGPVTPNELRRLEAAGQLNGESLIAEEGSEQWVSLASALPATDPDPDPEPSFNPIAEKMMPAQFLGTGEPPGPLGDLGAQLPPEDNPLVISPAQHPELGAGKKKGWQLFLNLIWLVFALPAVIGYYIAGFLACLTIIGIGSGLQSFKLARYILWPFGKRVVENPQKTGCLSTVGNVLWIIISGWWLALGHLIAGALCFIFVITIPFASRHFEFARLALAPYGKDVVAG